MPLITLTTDFGASDTFVGVMKGVILSIAPTAQIVDLCHGIPPQDILAGALALEESTAFFPPGTIHVAVVDPGVGSDREAVAIATDRDLHRPQQRHLRSNPQQGTSEARGKTRKPPLPDAARQFNISRPGHFAPAAAHLGQRSGARRTRPSTGRPDAAGNHRAAEAENSRPPRGPLRQSHHRPDRGILRRVEPQKSRVRVTIGQASFLGVSSTFADVEEGTVAYFGSGGRLEIAVRNSNAASYFQMAKGFSILLGKL